MDKKISEMTFESALQELEQIVTKLESGEIELENAVKSYEYGMSLQKHCQDKLSQAKMKIEKINNDGSVEKINIDLSDLDE